MAARKLAAVAELIRRRPSRGATRRAGADAGRVGEFTADELAHVLAESRGRADDTLTIARGPGTPGCRARGRRCGTGRSPGIRPRSSRRPPGCWTRPRRGPPRRWCWARAGRLTPGRLRAAIACAVMEVAPEKARRRREAAARDARVQRWAEDSGNAALMGRELPPAEVLAADQRITAWARQLKKAGLEGDMDVLRARAYLDLLLGKDSRPRQDAAGGQDGTGPDGPGGAGRRRAGARGSGRVRPAPRPRDRGGACGRVRRAGHPDRPAGHRAGLADRPGEIPGIGPVDPDPGANTPDRYQAVARGAVMAGRPAAPSTRSGQSGAPQRRAARNAPGCTPPQRSRTAAQRTSPRALRTPGRAAPRDHD